MATRRRDNSEPNGEMGAALVEFAIVAVVFFTIIFTIIQGAFIFGSWIVVTNAAREGARHGGLCISRAEMLPPQYCDDGLDWTAPTAAITEYTQGMVSWPSPQDNSYAWDWSGIMYDTNQAADPRLVNVMIKYQVPIFVPLLSAFLPNPLPLQAESAMRIED